MYLTGYDDGYGLTGYVYTTQILNNKLANEVDS